MTHVPTTRRLLALALPGLLAAASFAAHGQATPQGSPDGRSGVSNPQSGPISKGAQTPQRTEAAGAIRQQGAPMPGQAMPGTMHGSGTMQGQGGGTMQGQDGGTMQGHGGGMMQGQRGGVDDAHAAVFQALDLDHDGRLSRSEAAHARGVARHWSALDANRDGAISQDEFGAYALGGSAAATGRTAAAAGGGSAKGGAATGGR